MRAVVDDPDLLDVTGWSPRAVRRTSWLIGATFAVVSGILIFPTLSLDAVLLTLLVVQAFGAAAIGRFSSLPLTYVGGLVIGVASSVLTKEFSTFKSVAVQGVVPSLPFLVLFAILVLVPRRLPTIGLERLGRSGDTEGQALAPWLRLPVLAVAAVAALLVPHFAGTRLPVFISGAALISVFVSMVVLINLSGQVSLCHAAFAAAGGYDLLPPHDRCRASLAGGFAGVGCRLRSARGAGRHPRHPALGPLSGAGHLRARDPAPADAVLEGFMFGPLGTRVAPRPDILGLAHRTPDSSTYLALGVWSCLSAIVLCRSRLGRILRAMADSPPGAGRLRALGQRHPGTGLLPFGGRRRAVGGAAGGSCRLGQLGRLRTPHVAALAGGADDRRARGGEAGHSRGGRGGRRAVLLPGALRRMGAGDLRQRGSRRRARAAAGGSTSTPGSPGPPTQPAGGSRAARSGPGSGRRSS